MDSATKISNTRAEQLSRFDSPDELSSKAKALLGENYKQYSTADKLKILRIFTKPPGLESASGSQLGKVSEISARYNRIEGNAEPLSLKAFEIIKASLPSYVQPMLFHWKLESFESALPEVTRNAQDAAKHFAGLSTETKLMLYGFSLCRKYINQLNELHGLASLYEKLKKSGGGMESVDLGYEYKDAFNRQLRTYLPEEQSRVLEELETEPSYDERKQKIINKIESALAELKGGASSEADSATTTANTTTSTTTITDTSLGSITSQRSSDMEIKHAASRISEPVNGLSHSLRLCLYLQHKTGTTTLPYATKNEYAALNEFEAQLKKETGKLGNLADKNALFDSVLEKVRDLLPAHMENELSKISSMPDSDARKAEFERLAHRVFVNVKTGSRLYGMIQSKCSAAAILNMIGYSFDRDKNRLSQMNNEEQWQFDYVCRAQIEAENPLEQQGFVRAFIECALSGAPETVQQGFREALLLLNPEEARKAVLKLVAEYLENPSAIASLKKEDEAS